MCRLEYLFAICLCADPHCQTESLMIAGYPESGSDFFQRHVDGPAISQWANCTDNIGHNRPCVRRALRVDISMEGGRICLKCAENCNKA